MAKGGSTWRRIDVRLIHDGVQPGAPLSEPLRFGLQDNEGEVHLGVAAAGQTRNFDFTVEVKDDAALGKPIFRGDFVHGPPAGRFIYLSWKRQGEHTHAWGWRIKIPLSGIGWVEIQAAERPDKCLEANVSGRRPHASEPVSWRVAPLHPT